MSSRGGPHLATTDGCGRRAPLVEVRLQSDVMHLAMNKLVARKHTNGTSTKQRPNQKILNWLIYWTCSGRPRPYALSTKMT